MSTPGSVGSFVRIVDLRANTFAPTSPYAVILEGYFAAGDGGGGTFQYIASDTTSPDNGGTIIVDAGARRWYRQGFTDQINARWFGAKGDGTADDTAALQSA